VPPPAPVPLFCLPRTGTPNDKHTGQASSVQGLRQQKKAVLLPQDFQRDGATVFKIGEGEGNVV